MSTPLFMIILASGYIFDESFAMRTLASKVHNSMMPMDTGNGATIHGNATVKRLQKISFPLKRAFTTNNALLEHHHHQQQQPFGTLSQQHSLNPVLNKSNSSFKLHARHSSADVANGVGNGNLGQGDADDDDEVQRVLNSPRNFGPKFPQHWNAFVTNKGGAATAMKSMTKPRKEHFTGKGHRDGGESDNEGHGQTKVAIRQHGIHKKKEDEHSGDNREENKSDDLERNQLGDANREEQVDYPLGQIKNVDKLAGDLIKKAEEGMNRGEISHVSISKEALVKAFESTNRILSQKMFMIIINTILQERADKIKETGEQEATTGVIDVGGIKVDPHILLRHMLKVEEENEEKSKDQTEDKHKDKLKEVIYTVLGYEKGAHLQTGNDELDNALKFLKAETKDSDLTKKVESAKKFYVRANTIYGCFVDEWNLEKSSKGHLKQSLTMYH